MHRRIRLDNIWCIAKIRDVDIDASLKEDCIPERTARPNIESIPISIPWGNIYVRFSQNVIPEAAVKRIAP